MAGDAGRHREGEATAATVEERPHISSALMLLSPPLLLCLKRSEEEMEGNSTFAAYTQTQLHQGEHPSLECNEGGSARCRHQNQ